MDNSEKSNLTHLYQANQQATEKLLAEQAKVELEFGNQLTPPPEVWDNLSMELVNDEAKINKNTRNVKRKFTTWAIAMAASVFMVSMSWLMWSNYNLQIQLQQVVLANKHLELQFKQDSIQTYSQSSLITEIAALESKLYFSKSEQEMLSLLLVRKKLMQQIIESQKEESHEYSI